jgi:heptosyltransferase-2
VWLSDVPVRVGYASDVRRFLLTEALPTNGLREEHLTANYLRLGSRILDALGVSEPESHRAPSPRVFESDRRTVENMLGDLPERGFAVVVPGAVYGSTKTWPREKFAALVRELSAQCAVVVAGSAGERGLCEAVAGAGQPRVYNVAGQTSLGEFFALLQRAGVVVANDSGAPHVAAALGAPVAVIFGSTSPRWTAPQGPVVHVIREPVHCAPCFLDKCPTELECYAGIDVRRVVDAAARALGENTGLGTANTASFENG